MSCGEELKSNQTQRYLVLPEIVFGLALRVQPLGVELLDGDGGLTAYPLQPNSEYQGLLAQESDCGG
jgi:hypothetical protein